MIDPAALPPISTILSRLGASPGRRGRTGCPIHRGDNRQAFSYDDDKGQWFCFRCGFGGDAIALIKKALETDFKGALRWVGIEPGQPPKPDPKSLRHKAAMDQVRQWNRAAGKLLRDEYHNRMRITACARKRLAINPDDEIAWEMLRIAYDGECKNEFLLDEIDLRRDDAERLEAWRKYRNEV